MIKHLAAASLLLSASCLAIGPARAADPGIIDTEILIGDVEPLTGPPALLGHQLPADAGERVQVALGHAPGGGERDHGEAGAVLHRR